MLAIAAAPALSQQLLHPGTPVASCSQRCLSGALAQWDYSFRAATSPLLDTTGAATASGDQGKYFFLAASLSETPVVRSVTVRNDQTLVFSPIAVLYWADAVMDTEAKMRADAIKALGTVSNLKVAVDCLDAVLPAGVSLTQAFRQSEPLFALSLPRSAGKAFCRRTAPRKDPNMSTTSCATRAQTSSAARARRLAGMKPLLIAAVTVSLTVTAAAPALADLLHSFCVA